MSWVTTVARLVLAGTLAWAGYDKIRTPELSVRAVDAYRVLSHDVAGYVGYALPVLQIGLALLLLVGLATRLAGVAVALLVIAFGAGVTSAWARGLSIECGCFAGGGPVDPGGTRYLQEVLGLVGALGLAMWVIVLAPGRFAVDRLTAAGTGKRRARLDSARRAHDSVRATDAGDRG